jgi:hypothetical protein
MQTSVDNLHHLSKTRAWSQWLSIEGIRRTIWEKDIPINVVQLEAPIEQVKQEQNFRELDNNPNYDN